MNVYDYVKVYNLIDTETIDLVKDIVMLNDECFKPHTWGDSRENRNDCKVLYSGRCHELLKTFIRQSIAYYTHDVMDGVRFANDISSIRMNIFDEQQYMQSHADAIKTLFGEDGIRGWPVLSIVGMIDPASEGGEFVINSDYKVELGRGDILIFPSTFIYKHEVKPVHKGRRISFVSWAW